LNSVYLFNADGLPKKIPIVEAWRNARRVEIMNHQGTEQ
jgi:hypothetical protein